MNNSLAPVSHTVALSNISLDRKALVLSGIAGVTILGVCYILTKNNYSFGYKSTRHSFTFTSPEIDEQC